MYSKVDMWANRTAAEYGCSPEVTGAAQGWEHR